MAQSDTLTLMTFNLRYFTAEDGENSWPHRRKAEFRVLQEGGALIVGTQEGLYDQLMEIAENNPQYAWIGMDRQGGHTDEHAAIYFRVEDVDLQTQGDFWLSETPGVPGSQSWKSSLPRMASWAVFRSAGKRFLVLNTHFDHRSEEARVGAARLVLFKLAELAKGMPCVVMGDFNASPGSEAYRILTQGDPALRDARVIAKERQGSEGTYHGWTGQSSESARIDWILVSQGIEVNKIWTVDLQDNGRYPSDHFPTAAQIKLV